MDESEFTARAIQKAQCEIAQALQRLESEIGRTVLELSIDNIITNDIRGNSRILRIVRFDMADRAGQGWNI